MEARIDFVRPRPEQVLPCKHFSVLASIPLVLDNDTLAVRDICNLELLCKRIYHYISSTCNHFVRRVSVYQWATLATFCRLSHRTYLEWVEEIDNVTCDMEELAPIYPSNNLMPSRNNVVAQLKATSKYFLRVRQQLLAQFYCLVHETRLVTQTSHSFWLQILRVNTFAIDMHLDRQKGYGYSINPFAVLSEIAADEANLFIVKMRRISLRSLKMAEEEQLDPCVHPCTSTTSPGL